MDLKEKCYLVSCTDNTCVADSESQVMLKDPVKSKLQHSPRHLNFGKIFVQVPPPWAKKLFKYPITGSFQLIQCPHPKKNYQINVLTFQ